jgi:hypothetical protein
VILKISWLRALQGNSCRHKESLTPFHFSFTEFCMSKLCICLVIVISISLAGCGVRYNWVPQGTVESGPPDVEYEGTGVPDRDSEL